jgi:hypothetical protein
MPHCSQLYAARSALRDRIPEHFEDMPKSYGEPNIMIFHAHHIGVYS